MGYNKYNPLKNNKSIFKNGSKSCLDQYNPLKNNKKTIFW